MNSQLTHFNKARQELALAQSVDEVKVIRDKAEMLRSYAKQAGESLVMQNMCAEIKIRAERRGGELLKERPPHPPGPSPQDKSHDATEPPKLEELGINKSQSSRWQQIAEVPEDSFDKYIAKTKEAKKELTTNSVLRLARDIKEAKAKANTEPVIATEDKYGTIVIDPPWPQKKLIRELRPNQHAFDYPTMTIEEITHLPIKASSMENCHLFMWTTQKYLPVAINILPEWGFRYVLNMVWHKTGGFQPFGLPQYNCEFVLYARKGSPKFIDTKNFFCCFEGKRREHSRKPDEFYDIIRRVTEEPRIDFFSREEREGFKQYGNETGRFET